jgi:putative PIN family toxin of toxin-antitoxin system
VRLVLDTNVAASGLLWDTGPPAQLLDAAQAGEVELFTTKPLLAELAEILTRRKFTHHVAASALTIEELVLGYAELATVVEPAEIAPTIAADPDDDEVLACALAAQADLIVSGDDALLNLKHYHGIGIVTPAVAIQRIGA